MRALSNRDALRPTQVYMLWCQFADNCVDTLGTFLSTHRQSIRDIGIEECYPLAFFDDRLMIDAQLTSLRVWSDGRRGRYAMHAPIATLNANAFDTVDLSAVDVSCKAIVDLIEAWWHAPNNRDVTISVADCPQVTDTAVHDECIRRNIPMQIDGRIRITNDTSLNFICV
jgi:hypothetical protein